MFNLPSVSYHMHDTIAAYRPVIIFHGILDGPSSMDDLVQQVKSSHSGTDVYDIDGYDHALSFIPMWKQVAGIKAKMLPIMEKATDGVNLICYSQGECKLWG